MLGMASICGWCILCFSLLSLIMARPLSPLDHSGIPKATVIELPKRIATTEDLVALAQYAMRLMASRINITLQPASIVNNLPKDAEILHNTLGKGHLPKPTMPTVFATRNSGNLKILNDTMEKSTGNDNKKMQSWSQKSEGTTKMENADNVFKESFERLMSVDKNPSHVDSINATFDQILPPVTTKPFTNKNKEVFTNKEVPSTSKPSSKYSEVSEKQSKMTSSLSASKMFLPLSMKYIEMLQTSIRKQLEEETTRPTPQKISSPREETKLKPHQEADASISGTTITGISPVEKVNEFSSQIMLNNITVQKGDAISPGSPVISMPFEAVITITRERVRRPQLQKTSYETVSARYPPDDFPPYFETVVSLGKSATDVPDLNIAEEAKVEQDDMNELEANANGTSAMTKRQTPKLSELLGMLVVTQRNTKGSINTNLTPPPIMNGFKTSNASRELITRYEKLMAGGKDENRTSQRQEIEEDDDDMGSIGSIADLLPLVGPIVEDLSDPNTETDIGELLQLGLPVIQGLSEGDENSPGIDIAGTLAPVIASLSGGNGRPGSDFGAVLEAVLPLVAPLIGPLIGPLVGPLIQGSSNPPAEGGGSSLAPLVQSLVGALSQPAEPGGVAPLSTLISGVVASLSKDLSTGKGSDVGGLISALVSAVVAGASAGVSGSLSEVPVKSPPPKASPDAYGSYGSGPVAASSVNTIELVGTSFKEILGSSLQFVKTIISSVTGILGASSAKPPQPVYGPARYKNNKV